MLQYPRPFHELVRAQQEVNPKHRKFQHKRGKKAKRHRINPHINRVTDQTKFRVTACTEDSGNQRSIYGRSHDVIGIDQQHIFEIMHCCLI